MPPRSAARPASALRVAALALALLPLGNCIEEERANADSHAPSLLPHNLTRCVRDGRPLALCEWFDGFNATGCVASATMPVTAERAFACLNASRCLAVYDVASCAGPRGFNYTSEHFNHSACVRLVESLNATLLGGNLSHANGTGCDALLPDGAPSSQDGDGTFLSDDDGGGPSAAGEHPCAEVLGSERVRRVAELTTARAAGYASYAVVGLVPSIGPVAGGVRVGVCGLGFVMTNEAVGHLACRFTDGRNLVDVPAVYRDSHQLVCDAPDFSRFAVGLPHNVSVEVTLNRGRSWSANHVQFTFYSTRPAIDAFGRPMWGYDPTFTKAAWQVAFDANDYGSLVEPLYPPSGHTLNLGRPSAWDSHRDPFHARGEAARWQPVELDAGERLEPAEDVTVAAAHASKHGVEGSWGDRKSFMRAHSLVPDTYRQGMAAARVAALGEAINNGVI
jgi:hypothetical protein